MQLVACRGPFWRIKKKSIRRMNCAASARNATQRLAFIRSPGLSGVSNRVLIRPKVVTGVRLGAVPMVLTLDN